MPERTLIHAPRDCDRLPLLLNRLEEWARQTGRRSPCLVFVPTAQRALQLRQALPTAVSARVVTFQQFMQEHYVSQLDERQFISEQDQIVVLRQILLEQPPAFFASLPRSWGVVSAVMCVLSLARDASDTAEGRALLFGELVEGDTDAGMALAEVDRAYYDYLAEHQLADRDVLRRELIAQWEQGVLPGTPGMMAVDGFSFFFTPVQRRVFAALMPHYERVVVTLASPHAGLHGLASHRGYEYVNDAWEWLKETDNRWHERAGDAPTDSLLAALQERLFTQTSIALSGTVPEKPFRLLAAPNRREEVRIIVRLIRQGLASGSSTAQNTIVALDDVAYAPMLRELFQEYGLPGPAPYREKLSHVPVIILLRKWIDGCLEAWIPSRLFDVLTSPWCDTDRACVRRLDQCRRSAKIHQAFDRQSWIEKIDQMLQRELLEDDPEIEDIVADETRYRTARTEVATDVQYVANYLRKAEPLRRAETVGEFVSALRALVREIGLQERVQAFEGDQPEQRRNRTAYDQFCGILDHMEALFALATPTGSVPYVCREYLYRRLDEETCTTIPHQEDCVRLMTPQQAASLQHDTLYILGAVEGVFPSRPLANFLISPDASERMALSSLSRLPEERFLFQQMIGNSQQVVLTHPRTVDGQELMPSPFVEEVRLLFEPGEMTESDIAPLQQEEQTPILATSEVLQMMGRLAQPEGWEQLGLTYGNTDVQLRSERLRQSRHRFSGYDGWLDPSASEIVWDGSRDGYYSTTHLDEYARCPARFFYHRVLQLDETAEADDEIAPDVRGRLVHRILEKFYRQNPELRGREPEFHDTAVEVMRDTAEQEMARYDEEYPNLYWEEERRALLKGLSEEEATGVLRAWLDLEWNREQDRLRGELAPAHFEYRFGPFYRQPGDGAALRLSRYVGPDICIRGKVDRVDRGPESFAVYDYKTGTTPSSRTVERGLNFQLVTYLLALESHGLGQPIAAAYYGLSRADQVRRTSYVADEAFLEGKGRKPNRFYPTEAFQALQDWVVQNIRTIDRHIQMGHFHPSLHDEGDAGCRYCPYIGICRYQATRQLNMELHPDDCYAPNPFSIDEE